jgi:ribosomal protein S8
MNGNSNELYVLPTVHDTNFTPITNPSYRKRLRSADKIQLPHQSAESVIRDTLLDLELDIENRVTAMMTAGIEKLNETSMKIINKYGFIEDRKVKDSNSDIECSELNTSIESNEKEDINTNIKVSKAKRRRARAKVKGKDTIIQAAKQTWVELQTLDRQFEKARDEMGHFYFIQDTPIKGLNKTKMMKGRDEAEMKMRTLDINFKSCATRMFNILEQNPTVLKHKTGIGNKSPSTCGSFDQEFQLF